MICENLTGAIDHYIDRLGYRLDMIMPADAPRIALLSKNGETIKLCASQATNNELPATNTGDWITGRAGMQYRDHLPERLGGEVAVSHIRLTDGGPVSDYVHYQKVDFQMIYCLKGSIRVVYEDQGPPFWLEPGDCVLQPSEIRHRVLEAEAGSEVIEISSPVEHETWVDHDLELSNGRIRQDRDFTGQRFVRHIAADAKWREFEGFEARDMGITVATDGRFDVRVVRSATAEELPANNANWEKLNLFVVLNGDLRLVIDNQPELVIPTGACRVLEKGERTSFAFHT